MITAWLRRAKDFIVPRRHPHGVNRKSPCHLSCVHALRDRSDQGGKSNREAQEAYHD